MKKIDQTDQYTLIVAESIVNIFKDEEERTPVVKIDLETVDGTKFITSLIMACNYVYNKLTGQEVNSLGFTHLANQLIVQYLMDANKEKA